MLPLSEIICLVSALATGNNTDDLLPTVVSFIETYYNDFPMDFIPCKNVLNGRFKKGKLEEILIYLFAEICNWSNTDENLRSVHKIMVGLGYESYDVASRRYRQMVENAKKELKKNTRIRNRIRNIHSKIVNHKTICCREYKRSTAKRALETKATPKVDLDEYICAGSIPGSINSTLLSSKLPPAITIPQPGDLPLPPQPEAISLPQPIKLSASYTLNQCQSYTLNQTPNQSCTPNQSSSQSCTLNQSSSQSCTLNQTPSQSYTPNQSQSCTSSMSLPTSPDLSFGSDMMLLSNENDGITSFSLPDAFESQDDYYLSSSLFSGESDDLWPLSFSAPTSPNEINFFSWPSQYSFDEDYPRDFI